MKKKNKRIIGIIIAVVAIVIIGFIIYFHQKYDLPRWLRTRFSGEKAVVILDAGHGGYDPGCGQEKPYEKEIAFNIVNKIQKQLERLGYSVVLTRDDDTYVSLGDRVLKSRVYNGDLFVSIHLNWAENRQARGIETYCNEELNADSATLAKQLHKNVLLQTNATDRKVHKESNYYVVCNSKVPSCLVEVGFLSSDKEGSLLKNDSYQEKIADGITNGIFDYLEGKNK